MPRRPVRGLVTSWPGRPPATAASADATTLPRHRAAERIESYVYGNVITLVAVASADAASVQHGDAALLVIGTAVSTFVAHLLAVSVAHRRPEDHHLLRASVRDSVPIATSGLLPTLVLLAGWFGWLAPTPAVLVALISVVVRFVFLGSVVSHLDGEESTWKNVLLGVALAVAGLVVAAVKLVLTH